MTTHLTTAEVMGMAGSYINETSYLAQWSTEQELHYTCCARGSLRHQQQRKAAQPHSLCFSMERR